MFLKSFASPAVTGLALCVSLSCNASDISIPLESSLDSSLVKAFNMYLGQNTSLTDKISDLASVDSLIESAELNAGQLHVNFDRAKLELFVKSRNASVLGAIEDPVLVYMVSMSESSQSILSDGVSDSLNSVFLQSADLNSIRIMFPLMDLDDIQKFNANTILSHNDSSLAAASLRYGSDFYIAGAIENTTQTDVALKFNVCTKDGVNIHSGSLAGPLESVVNALMHECRTAISSFKNSTQVELKKELNADNNNEVKLLPADLDVNTLGPGQDFVRLALYNVNSLDDIKAIKDAFITYGYDSNVNIVRIEGDHLILELKTHAKPAILDSTMRRAGDFKYLSAWSYTFIKSQSNKMSHFNTMGRRYGGNAVFGSDIKASENKAQTLEGEDSTVPVKTHSVKISGGDE